MKFLLSVLLFALAFCVRAQGLLPECAQEVRSKHQEMLEFSQDMLRRYARILLEKDCYGYWESVSGSINIWKGGAYYFSSGDYVQLTVNFDLVFGFDLSKFQIPSWQGRYDSFLACSKFFVEQQELDICCFAKRPKSKNQRIQISEPLRLQEAVSY